MSEEHEKPAETSEQPAAMPAEPAAEAPGSEAPAVQVDEAAETTTEGEGDKPA